ncbi:putative glycoside hydrolase [Leptospira ellisii]|uniref:Glycoside hydrolase n=1 Tax=Leptospira ellisii TaxID=2023197 RepID=A0AAE4QPG8_9LEPT|nr:putative glycoside hydrolase [Leptospira ellisii]MDV6236778.1 putative glycoside hydrolase [Leptospira ellisii]PKA05363.1 glycosyl hydrolase [Leptospira ellisii]
MVNVRIIIISIFLIPLYLYADFDLPFPKVFKKGTSQRQVLIEENKEARVSSVLHTDKPLKNQESPNQKIKTSPPNTLNISKNKHSKENVTIQVVTTEESKKSDKSVEHKIFSNSLVGIPNFARGIYISQRTLKKTKVFQEIRRKAIRHGINLLVIDVQPTILSKGDLDSLIEEGFYPVARVVNFEGGLPTEKPTEQRITSIYRSIRGACQSGFPEIQLDYIRYADNLQLKLSYDSRYKNISGIIKNIRNETLKCENLPYIGADIFGRIPFNQNDMIGQKVEVFAQVVDVLYPMLYPSHFYGMPDRIKDPYQTVYDGTLLTLKRSLKTTRVIPYIQGFNMSVGKSGLSLADYIKAQVKASYDSGGHGFVVWNAWNEYEPTFQALKSYDEQTKKKD